MPQPIDMNTEVAKLADATRAQEMVDRASLVAQHRVSRDVQDKDAKAETQVQETKDTRGEEVDAEGRRSNPFVGRKRKRRKKRGSKDGDDPANIFYNANEQTETAGDDEGGNFDVTI